MRSNKMGLAVALLVSLQGACSDDDGRQAAELPWAGQRTRVVDANGAVTAVEPVAGSGCVTFEGECLKPQETCGKAASDVLLDTDGKALAALCYPGEATLSVADIEAQQGDVAQRQNNAVIVLDDLDDGPDIRGSLSVDANNVVIYGEQPASSVIGGDVTLDGNNAFLRGVRVEGGLTVSKNNAKLAFCVIEGDLVVMGSGAQIVGCHVFGNVTLGGNGAQLMGTRIGGTLQVAGQGAECRDNFAVADADGDAVLDDGELGQPLTCG